MVRTQRRDDVLRADRRGRRGHAGPERAAGPGRRGARSGRRDEAEPDVRDADGRSGAARLDPGARRRRCCCSATRSRARGRRWSASRACCSSPAPPRAQRPIAGRARAGGRRPAPRPRANSSKEAGAGTRDATRPSTTPAPRRWRRGGSTSRAARWRKAAKSLDPELRYRALYNLGLVDLLAARADTAGARASCWTRRSDRLRQALLLQPASAARQVEPRAGRAPQPPPPPQRWRRRWRRSARRRPAAAASRSSRASRSPQPGV